MRLFFLLIIIVLNCDLSYCSNEAYHLVHFEPIFNKTKNYDSVIPQEIIRIQVEEEARNYPNHTVYVLSTGTLISPILEDGVNAMDYRSKLKRYEVQLRNSNFIRHPMIPISPCHDSIDGFGGSTGYQGTLGIGSSLSLGVDLGTVILNMIDITLGVSLSNTVTASETISCTVKEGDAVQIFVEPWILNTDYRYRSYYTAGGHGKLKKSSWSVFQNNDFPVSITPAPFCHTGRNNVKCNVTPQNTIFLENGAYI